MASGRSASGSNITVLNEVEISSEEPVGNWDIQLSSQSQSQNVSRQASQITLAGQSLSQSQSVDISSQSVAGGAKQSQISYGSESSESSDSCIIDFPPSRRRPPSADDGQQPGPSNVKRRRVSPRGNRRKWINMVRFDQSGWFIIMFLFFSYESNAGRDTGKSSDGWPDSTAWRRLTKCVPWTVMSLYLHQCVIFANNGSYL